MNGTRQVVILTTLSFIMFSVGTGYRRKSFELPKATNLAGWALLLIMLTAVSDFEQTAELAAALAWLIFITVFLTYGVNLFDKINEWVGQK